MKKRLRKKRRIGEFAELGFAVKGLHTPIRDPEHNAFIDRCLAKVEELKLGFCAYWGPTFFDGYIQSMEKLGKSPRRYKSVTEEQRVTLLDWLKAQPEMKYVLASPLLADYSENDLREYPVSYDSVDTI